MDTYPDLGVPGTLNPPPKHENLWDINVREGLSQDYKEWIVGSVLDDKGLLLISNYKCMRNLDVVN